MALVRHFRIGRTLCATRSKGHRYEEQEATNGAPGIATNGARTLLVEHFAFENTPPYVEFSTPKGADGVFDASALSPKRPWKCSNNASNKMLLGTSASLLVTSALLVVTRSYKSLMWNNRFAKLVPITQTIVMRVPFLGRGVLWTRGVYFALRGV